MKTLLVPYLVFTSLVPDLKEVSKSLDALGNGYAIDQVNWPGYDYRPKVRFNIAYGDREIYIKYYVDEQLVRAVNTKPNDPVWQDSCVEFFVIPEEDGVYYNFEFNSIGACLMGKGPNRNDRHLVDPSYIAKIRRMGTMGTEPFDEKSGEFHWELIVAIPLDAFAGKEIKTLAGKVFKANFYKCGDNLSKPHYLTWNPIGTPNPDYHRPEFFGTIEFEKPVNK